MGGDLQIHMESPITLEISMQRVINSAFVCAVCISVVRVIAAPIAVGVNLRLKLPMTITVR
jgi:hypothetical protein